MKRKEGPTTISVRLAKSQVEEVARVADTAGLTVTAFVRVAVAQMLTAPPAWIARNEPSSLELRPGTE